MERVYVGNLPPDIRIKDIDDFFRPFGKLVAIDVNNRSNPAFAFVQFDSPRNAISAVRNRHGYDYEGYTLQVKLVENAVNAPFEVRNQRRQQTPPPPPPVFNDFNNQMGGGYGNNNFGRNFGNNSNSGGNFGDTNGGNFGGNTNFGNSNFGNNFPNDNFNNSSSSFQRNMSSQNMIQYPNTNVRSIMPAQNNMIEYPRNSAWGSGGGGGGNSNRSGGGGSNRGSGGMGNNYGNMGAEYSFNPNNNCYADNDFEDRYTQGLSGSGRKWFNRYIIKGFAPPIAREKAFEHRTVPYLRDHPKRDQIPNNAVANLPLPALENFGNKLISLFSGNNVGGGGGGNFGGNWGNNNLQGGFSNDFNMAGPSSSNYRAGNRNNEIRSLVPARTRGGRADVAKGSESGILEKMLSEIPRGQRKLVAKEIYNKSMAFLNGPIKANDRIKKKYHKQIVQEYETKYNTKNLSITNIKSDKSVKSVKSIDELKRKYHEKKMNLYQQARRLPEYPGGKLSEIAKTKIKLLLENGFVEPGATTLSKLPMPTIKQFIQLKQTYEAAVKTTTKVNVVKTKSDKEAAHLNNLKLLRKYEVENPRTASNSLIMACLKKIRQYEKEMKLKPITTKFDKIKKSETTAKKPVAKTVDTKDKQKKTVKTVAKVVEDNAENKEAEGEIQDSNETENKTDDTPEADQENMEITEDQKDKNDVTENETDEDDNVELIEDNDVELIEEENENEDNQEEQNEK